MAKNKNAVIGKKNDLSLVSTLVLDPKNATNRNMLKIGNIMRNACSRKTTVGSVELGANHQRQARARTLFDFPERDLSIYISITYQYNDAKGTFLWHHYSPTNYSKHPTTKKDRF